MATRTSKNAFFEFFLRKVSTTPPPAHPIYPRGGEPSTPAHPDGLHSTGSITDRARCKADHTRQGTHARTLDTLHRSALDTRYRTRRSDRARAGLEGLRSVSETVQIWTLKRHTKTGLKIITILCMFVACATLQIHEKVLL